MMNAVALCAVGAERALSNELRKLDYSVLESSYGKVRFRSDAPGLYRALMSLRTADRLLLEAGLFDAPDFDALFEGVRNIPWEDLIPPDTRVTVAKVRSSRSKLQAETSIQAVVHKAAAERLCQRRGVQRLPEYGDGAELRVYLEKDKASILLDLSGEPLFKRGYRSEGGTAPLRETTAAAIVLLSGWRRKYPLCDPFCGSGTILLEAAMYAWDAAPGMGRSFAISRLALADQDMEASIRKELLERVDCTRTIRLFGSDADLRAVSIAESNARRAFELAHGQKPGRGIRLAPGAGGAVGGAGSADEEATLPKFKIQDAADAIAPETEGFIITNPPYGERLGDLQSAERTYQEMRSLEDRFPGWKLVVVTNHPGFESHFGYAADSVREITNGALRTFLYTYDQLGRKADVHRSRT